MTCTRLVVVLLLGAGWLFDGPRAHAQQIDVQYKRKADMLCPLAGIMLPAAALAGGDGTFRIGVLGRDPFDGQDIAGNFVNHLDEMARVKRTYKEKRIVISRFSSAKDYRPCQVLFISALSAPDSAEKSAAERLAAVLKIIKAAPVLLVGDTPGLAERGAHINFFVAADAQGVPKVMFEITPGAAKRAGLTIDAGLLRLAARIVQDNA
jgi:hypothetical protein